jgi:hypothetical protein
VKIKIESTATFITDGNFLIINQNCYVDPSGAEINLVAQGVIEDNKQA